MHQKMMERAKDQGLPMPRMPEQRGMGGGMGPRSGR
jgi:hypothetical protein